MPTSHPQIGTPVRRNGGSALRWPLAAAAAVVLLGAAQPAFAADPAPLPEPTSTAPADPGGTVVSAVPGVTVHDDAGCLGPGSSAVTADFSVAVSGLTGGPLAAVTVRSDTLVAASAVAMLDDQGSGCADLPAVDPGTYTVTASIGDSLASATVVVPAPPEPPTTPTPEPVPPTDPPVVDPPAETQPPPDTTPTEPAVPTEPTSPARSSSPSAEPTPGATEPAMLLPSTGTAPGGGTGAAAARPSTPGSPGPRVTAPAQVSPAPPAPSEQAEPTATAVLDSTSTAAARVVAALTSSDRPAAVTIAGFVIFEILGASLLVAFVVLLLSRAPRRKG